MDWHWGSTSASIWPPQRLGLGQAEGPGSVLPFPQSLQFFNTIVSSVNKDAPSRSQEPLRRVRL